MTVANLLARALHRPPATVRTPHRRRLAGVTIGLGALLTASTVGALPVAAAPSTY